MVVFEKPAKSFSNLDNALILYVLYSEEGYDWTPNVIFALTGLDSGAQNLRLPDYLGRIRGAQTNPGRHGIRSENIARIGDLPNPFSS